MQLKKLKAPGTQMPHGYGVAYYDYRSRNTVLYPLPLNFVVGWARQAYFRLTDGPFDPNSDNRQKAYGEGYADGFERGYSNEQLAERMAAAKAAPDVAGEVHDE